jgi:hypothetical protein
VNTEQQLREILHTEVADLEPSPAGWDAIQRRVAGRRRRFVLQRALPAVTGLAVLGLVAAVAIPRLGDDATTPRPPTTSGSATSEPTAPAPGDAPIQSVWPFTWRSQVAAWEDASPEERQPGYASSTGTAGLFAVTYVGLPEASVTVDGEVILGKDGTTFVRVSLAGGQRVTVALRDAGHDPEPGPFIVVSAHVEASDGEDLLSVDSNPDPTTVVGAPTATFTGTIVDWAGGDVARPRLEVTLRDGRAKDLGSRDAVIDGDTWEVVMPVPAVPEGPGAVLVRARDAQGGIEAFAATPLTLAPASSTPTLTPTSGFRFPAPTEFIGVQDGVVAVFRAADGTVVRRLTEPQPGGGAYDPSVDSAGGTVTFAQGAGTCAAGIYSVPLDGGAPTEVVDASHGAASGPARNGVLLAYVLARCTDGGTTVDLMLRDLATGKDTVLATARGTDAGFRSLSWSPDERELAVIAEGVEADAADPQVRIYRLGHPTPTVAGAHPGCTFTATVWMRLPGREGLRLVTAEYCGAEGDREARLYDSTAIEESERAPLLVRGEVPIMTLDVDRTGQWLLASESIRSRGIELWRWDVRNPTAKVPAPPDLQSPSW